MKSLCRFRDLGLGALFLVAMSNVAFAAGPKGPCSNVLCQSLKIANAAPDVCETSTRLVPGRAVVLALWSTEPDSPAEIPLAAVLDANALAAGRRVFLYKRRAMGESLEPFLFDGKTVNVAIADFEGNGHFGFGAWLVPDADYFFAITTYDPSKKIWTETPFTATDLDAKVEVTPGRILIPVCDTDAGSPSHPVSTLYFEEYRLKNGRYEHADKRILATSAPERDKCRMSGQ